MKHITPRFLIVNGEVMLPNEDDPGFYTWECPGCGYIKLSGSLDRT